MTEAGLGYTWAGNSQMNRLTPWSNDPVVRPARRGRLSARRGDRRGLDAHAAAPAAGAAVDVVRHGQGYTRFTAPSHGLEQDLLVLVPPDDPVKLVRLTRAQHRRPAAAAVGDVLRRVGARDASASRPRCRSCASATRSPAPLLARNAWAGDFAGRVAFADVGPRPRSVTADRAEFLGRNGTPAAPGRPGRAAACPAASGRHSTRAPR